MAKIDLGKVVGERGERGTLIYSGTAITGEEMLGTVFFNSGIEYALQEDKYINTLTNDMYTCITEGDAYTAEWSWIGNIQGKQGIPGEPGATGKVDETTPIDFEEYPTRDNLESGDSIAVLMGKTQKHFDDMSDSAYLPVVNDLESARAGEGVLDAYQGKVLGEKIDELNSRVSTVGNIKYNEDDDYIYINNIKWMKANIGKVYLYNQGYQCEDVTGGWHTGTVLTSYSDISFAPKLSFNATIANDDFACSITTYLKIDFTNFTRLYAECTEYKNNVIIIFSTDPLDNPTALSVANSKDQRIFFYNAGTAAKDISDYNGEYYVAFTGVASAVGVRSISKIWLE